MDSTRDSHIKRDRGPTLAHLWISGFIQKQEECMLQGGKMLHIPKQIIYIETM